MKTLKILLASTVLAGALAGVAGAQEAASLDQLLRQVQQGAANDQREAQARLQEFGATKPISRNCCSKRAVSAPR